MPAQHNCQARAGEFFRPIKFVNLLIVFLINDTYKRLNETGGVNVGSYLTKKKIENSSRRKHSCTSRTDTRRTVEFACKLICLRRSRKQL